MTGSIKRFCQKRRKIVYENITQNTEEEERFSAHIEAFGHKMRQKIEAFIQEQALAGQTKPKLSASVS